MMNCAVCGQPAPVWDEKRRRWLCYTHTIRQLKQSINHPTDYESENKNAEAETEPEQDG